MPTGYTAGIISHDIDFKEYAMGCARAFGACVTMRDSPKEEIPERFDASDHHIKKLDEAINKLKTLELMDEDQRVEHGQALKDEEFERHSEYLVKRKLDNQKFKNMSAKVSDWISPTADHDEFKAFMLDQLSISIDDIGYWEKKLGETTASNALTFYHKDLAIQKWNIDYHTKENKQEIKRVASRNQWLSHLRSSLTGDG